MSSRPDPDGHNRGKTEHQLRERLVGDQVRKLLSAVKLNWVSRRGWLTLALSLLGVTSALAIWQLHWSLPLHEPWAFLSFSWWSHPVEFNPDASLPQFNRRLEVAAVQGDRRVWVAGEAGFLAITENDGLEWKELKYDYDTTSGALHRVTPSTPAPNPSGTSAPTTRRFDFDFHLVPYAFAGEPPAGIVPSPRSLSFSKQGESQLVTLMNETRYPAYFDSISAEPPSVFAVGSECKLIEPGQKCVLNVRFNAPSGTYKGQLVVQMQVSQGSSSSRRVAVYVDLNGTATPSNTGVSPATVRTAPVNTNDTTSQANAPASDRGQTNSPASNVEQSKPSSNPTQGSTTPTNPGGKPEAAVKKPPVDRTGTGGSKPANTGLTPEQVAALNAPVWKAPPQLGTILAMEWTSPTEGRMVTDDAVIYRTSDGGESWQAQPWAWSGDSAKNRLSIGGKDLVRTQVASKSPSGTAPVVVSGNRIPKGSVPASILNIAEDPSTHVLWMITRPEAFGSNSVPRLVRSEDGGISAIPASRTADEGVYWRLPAPWYWFMALPLVLLAAAAAAFAGSDDNKVQESVSNIGISDRPLEPGEPDVMNLNALAQGLSLFLRNKSTKPPLVIAVNGDWGTGKSSLMNLLQHDLQRRGARAVWFNAWHHQEEKQLLAALLQTVRKKAVPSWYTLLGLWLRMKLIVKRGRQYWFPFAILFAATMFLISLAIDIHHARSGLISDYTKLWVTAYKDFEKSDVIPSWLKHASLYSTILGVLYGLNGVRKGATAFGANPASLLASISGSGRIRDLEAQTSFRQQFASEFRQVVEVLGSRRLLIVIDDLDRCQPDKVSEVLETVNFLISSADCFVILGLARPIVEHCVGLGFAKVVDSMPPAMLGLPDSPPPTEAAKRETFARRYLDKLVQLELSLPQLTTDQARMLLGAEPAAFLSDEIRRKMADLQHRRRKLEERLRVGLRGLWAWAVPVAVCVALALVLWRQAHSLVGPAMALIDSQIETHEVTDARPATSANGGGPAGQTTPPPPGKGAPSISTSAVPSAPAAPPATGPGMLAGSSPQPEGWIQSSPALLILIWVLWFSYDSALRRTQLVSRDSPVFRVALDIWSPVVMSVMNTPRSAKRFLNRVRYLAMRQRALSETHKPSLLDRFIARVGKLFVAGSKEKASGHGLAPDPAGASAGPIPRSLGAAAAQPAVLGITPVPESLLVALAAIDLVPGAWKGLLENDDWKNLESKYFDLIKVAVDRHEKELGDWNEIRSHIDAYLLLCSEVVTH